jgi:hypothetical protein
MAYQRAMSSTPRTTPGPKIQSKFRKRLGEGGGGGGDGGGCGGEGGFGGFGFAKAVVGEGEEEVVFGVAAGLEVFVEDEGRTRDTRLRQSDSRSIRSVINVSVGRWCVSALGVQP